MTKIRRVLIRVAGVVLMLTHAALLVVLWSVLWRGFPLWTYLLFAFGTAGLLHLGLFLASWLEGSRTSLRLLAGVLMAPATLLLLVGVLDLFQMPFGTMQPPPVDTAPFWWFVQTSCIWGSAAYMVQYGALFSALYAE